MDWEKYVKKYVWDEKKTPFFLAVDKLSQAQARNELFLYAFFLATLFLVVTLGSALDLGTGKRGFPGWVAAYAFSVTCGAIALGQFRNFYAALYCISAPLLGMVYALSDSLHPNFAAVDKYFLLILCLLWLRYAMRVLGIVKAFPRLPRTGE